LPVYTLLIATFVPALPLIPGLDLQGATMLAMYLLGTVAALARRRALPRDAPPRARCAR
jgi:ferrous iron transport protein B